MKNKRGFTLLELLIAATIVAALAVFATISYRDVSGEVRVQAGRDRTKAVALAVLQYKLDKGWAEDTYPDCEFPVPGDASYCTDSELNWAKLKKYLPADYSWDDFVKIYVCAENTGNCSNSNITSWDAVPLACMKIVDPKRPEKYKENYLYCVNERFEGEYNPSGSIGL